MRIKPPSASRMAVRTALILLVFVIAFTALLAGSFFLTEPRIQASAQDEKRHLIDDVLPASLYNNDLLADALTLPPTPQLGLDKPSTLYRARLNGTPAALVFEAVAPDGYSGKIRMLIAVAADGRLTGVRITEHKETPGLGDYIDPKRDRNKTHPWIEQFDGLSRQLLPDNAWRVKKDGGHFDAVAGATVTPRAVVKAVHRALVFSDENRERLFAAPAAQTAQPGQH